MRKCDVEQDEISASLVEEKILTSNTQPASCTFIFLDSEENSMKTTDLFQSSHFTDMETEALVENMAVAKTEHRTTAQPDQEHTSPDSWVMVFVCITVCW